MLFINSFKKILIGFLFFILLFIISISCDSTEPPSNQSLALKLEDVGCTEAWLQLNTNNIQLPATINLLKNNSVTQTFSLSTKDSLLYIDSLLPKQNYSFQVSSIPHSGGQNLASSNKVPVTTLGTTSHIFTFQTFSIGDAGAGSSLLYDVAIINENDIWAVGEIYMNDSLGNPDPNAYNAVHWNGQSWELKRIKTKACGGVDYPPIKTIFAFSMNDILFAHIDGSISYFNGIEFTNDCSLIIQVNGSANKMWGISKNDFYVVSGNGFIAHYQNGSWTKIESGTTTNVNDAWGVVENGISTVYSPVSSAFDPPQDKKILKIRNGVLDSLSWDKDRILYSCWANNNNYLYVCGSGVYQNKSGQWRQENLPSVSMNMVRGNAINDIFIIGDFGLAAHFNGSSWQVYNDGFGDIWGLAFKQNLVAFVGQKNGYGAITIGNKN